MAAGSVINFAVVNVLGAYCRANEADRPLMDLSALSEWEQDWLLNISAVDLVLLGGSPLSAVERSLEHRMVIPHFAKPKRSTETSEILPSEEDVEQRRRDFVSARFRELFNAPGVPNLNPKYAPEGA
ncbi:hypothetical protein HGP14_15790 [Rhizobium sp. P32RR-XVIII]|uniref:hypothetical protein n=1 Tax=Rhizobium sp. P32RR-XVIII TaxID=2726738 RepID=UPI001456E8C1|nr:hypothetical protein [Rhizobium sp. P32RR-XVIII]NLS04818.1 hypothetical protein [Rhizobium sp. P32RR-XVIII]